MTIRIIDLETTGINATAHVVEVGSVDLLPDGIIARAQEHLVKPPCLIPAEAQAVHHITDEDVAHAKPWKVVADAFFNRSACSDLVAFAAHNAAFEKQWLTPALLHGIPLICTYKGAVRLWPQAPRHSNQVLRYWLQLDLDRSIADRTHRAMPYTKCSRRLLSMISLLGLASRCCSPKCHSANTVISRGKLSHLTTCSGSFGNQI
jgi:exodeoxyribonuclease X